MARKKKTGRRGPGMSTFAAGLLTIGLATLIVFLGFTKYIPFQSKFEIEATFESANSIRNNSPVRIAGVNVGKVSGVRALEGSDMAVVTMEIQKQGQPIHKDATAKIRPRIFLEGNFFVDLQPGTPEAPRLGNGDMIRVAQTARAVQLDEVLTSLQSGTREDLKDLLDSFSRALGDKTGPDGRSAAEALAATYDDAAPAQRDTAIVTEALLGEQPNQDLQRTFSGLAKATRGLDRNPEQLKSLVRTFNQTMQATAAESVSLRQSIRDLAPTLRVADGTLDELNRAFPPTRRFVRDIRPGVRETASTINASFPFVEQVRRLVSPAELGGLARQLSPATRDLARLTDSTIRLAPQINSLARCLNEVVLPTGDIVIKDEFTTGVENYKEFFYGLVGLAGEGQNFDGNGNYVRLQPGGGSQTVQIGSSGSLTPSFANVTSQPIGSRPAYPGGPPVVRTDKPCHDQKIPDLNGFAARKGGAPTPVSSRAGKTRIGIEDPKGAGPKRITAEPRKGGDDDEDRGSSTTTTPKGDPTPDATPGAGDVADRADSLLDDLKGGGR